MDIVAGVLQKELKKSEKYKPTSVDKHLNLEFDIGTLLTTDPNDLDNKQLLESSRDEYLLNLTRDNTQLLFNQIWELPTEKMDETIVVTLPEPKFVLPRARRVPKPKEPTKWEQFAKEKGIKKKKKDKATWDETLQKWIPNYGYKKAKSEQDKDWVIDVPQNVDPMTDMFAKKSKAKSEKVAKNELQRLENIARARKVKIPRVGLPVTSDKASSKQLATAITVARASTASAGKFQPRLPKEKDAQGKGVAELVGNRKRKAPPPDLGAERKNNLEIVDGLTRKQPKVDVEMAVNRQIRDEQLQRSREKSEGQPKGKLSKHGKKGKGFKNKAKKGGKPAAGKGQRNPSKRNIGRKRR